MDLDQFKKEFFIRFDVILGNLTDQISDIKDLNFKAKIENHINNILNEVRLGLCKDMFEANEKITKIRNFVEVYLKIQ